MKGNFHLKQHIDRIYEIVVFKMLSISLLRAVIPVHKKGSNDRSPLIVPAYFQERISSLQELWVQKELSGILELKRWSWQSRETKWLKCAGQNIWEERATWTIWILQSKSIEYSAEYLNVRTLPTAGGKLL